jgi:hypothetical protein
MLHLARRTAAVGGIGTRTRNTAVAIRKKASGLSTRGAARRLIGSLGRPRRGVSGDRALELSLPAPAAGFPQEPIQTHGSRRARGPKREIGRSVPHSLSSAPARLQMTKVDGRFVSRNKTRTGVHASILPWLTPDNLPGYRAYPQADHTSPGLRARCKMVRCVGWRPSPFHRSLRETMTQGAGFIWNR